MHSFGLNAEEYQIIKGEHGKPIINSSKKENLYFNISHKKDLWVCATSNCEIGVDIELCANGRKNVAEYYFSDEEKLNLNQNQDYNKTFFEIWTGKEAYAKLIGEGLSATLLRSHTITHNNVKLNNKPVANLYRPQINNNVICTIATNEIIESIQIININSITIT